jgi:hypothetical protein
MLSQRIQQTPSLDENSGKSSIIGKKNPVDWLILNKHRLI